MGIGQGRGLEGRRTGGPEGEGERWVDLRDILEGESAMLADVHVYPDFFLILAVQHMWALESRGSVVAS